jgi:hypothetical protein
LLDGVLYTAGKARFSEFELAGLTHDEARQTVSHVCLPALSRYLGTTGDLDELPPLNLTVLLDGDGIRVAGSAAVLADADGEAPTILWATQADPFGELHSLLVQIKDEYPDDEDVILVTEGDVPYHRVMAALDASRERDSGREGYPDDLFPYAIYVGGIGVPAPVDLAGDPLLGGLLGTSGLGGLGTAGSSSDSSGYGSGGGAFGSGATGADTPGDPIILGALDKATIDAEIKSHLAQIRFCYQRELNKQPGLAGKLTVKFVIAADGTVSSGSTRSTTLNNVTVESCVLAVIRRMEFPPPDGGGIVIVSYPFVFKSGNGSAE